VQNRDGGGNFVHGYQMTEKRWGWEEKARLTKEDVRPAPLLEGDAGSTRKEKWGDGSRLGVS